MKGLFGGAALAALVLAVSALSANDASYTVVRMASPQITPYTCWYNADGVTTVCQDQ